MSFKVSNSASPDPPPLCCGGGGGGWGGGWLGGGVVGLGCGVGCNNFLPRRHPPQPDLCSDSLRNSKPFLDRSYTQVSNGPFCLVKGTDEGFVPVDMMWARSSVFDSNCLRPVLLIFPTCFHLPGFTFSEVSSRSFPAESFHGGFPG